MRSISTILAVLIAALFITTTVQGQTITKDELLNLDTPNLAKEYRKYRVRSQSITIALLPLIDRTLSISYSRKLNNGNELIINPRIRIAKPNPQLNTFSFFSIDDPWWYYNQYMIRAGIGFDMGRGFSYVPQLQLGYGAFFDKKLIIDDAHGDAYDISVRLNRQYFSSGIINTLSWSNPDTFVVRTKFFVGIGLHGRRYWERQYERYMWHRAIETYSPPNLSAYYKGVVTIHAGMEIGIRY